MKKVIKTINFCPSEKLIINYLEERCQENWLINYNSQDFYLLTKLYRHKINKLPQTKPIVFLAESNYFKFLAGFLASITSECTLFLINPNWKENEIKQLFNLVKPNLILGKINYEFDVNNNNNINNNYLNKIMIPTGGSSGNLKFAIHSWQSLTNSVKSFSRYFNQQLINSFCLLPLYHVSGLMQFMRSFLTRGKFAIASYTNLKQGQNYNINPADFFISLVPTQLQYLLENKLQWLAKFKTVLVGGGPTNNYLLAKAREHKINVALTYGMTETASGISILKPEDFLQGNNSSGQILPNVDIFIDRETNNFKRPLKTGIIKIKSKSLFQGYYPHQLSNQEYFLTDDIGYLDEQNYLHIVGRNSRKIITGGENVYPSEVEKVILATGLVKDVYVMGKPHQKWGEVVIAIYVPKSEHIREEIIINNIKDKLNNYKIPKYWYQIQSIPRNSQGKINFNLIVHTKS